MIVQENMMKKSLKIERTWKDGKAADIDDITRNTYIKILIGFAYKVAV